MTTGEKIVLARKRKHMSQQALADAVGTNQQMISQYEQGKHMPTITRLREIAKALDIDPSQLI